MRELLTQARDMRPCHSLRCPIPLIEVHGDFDTGEFVDWVGVLDNVVAIGLVAALGGLVSMRLFRAARSQPVA